MKMATKRKYGYYIKGNRIAIIEEGQGSGVCSLSGYNTQSACEDAGGTWTENASGVNDGEYRSPIQTITGAGKIGRRNFLQQPPLSGFPKSGAGITVHSLVQSHLHGDGLEETLLPTGRRAC